jgi:hypothetical protein
LKSPIKLPLLAQPANDHDDGFPGSSDSIVGLWHVIYTVGDTTNLFAESFKQWHGDHTEFEGVDQSAVVGNICFGVWKQLRPGVVRLHHTGWTFDDTGAPTGTFTNDETDTVSRDGKTYTGTFTFKVFDMNGNLQPMDTTTGAIAATRITVD